MLFLASSRPLQLFPFLILQNDPQNILCTELLELCKLLSVLHVIFLLSNPERSQQMNWCANLIACQPQTWFAGLIDSEEGYIAAANRICTLQAKTGEGEGRIKNSHQ